MTAPSPLPTFVYKITESAPPDPIPAEYPLSSLDKQDGFVHLSTGQQIPITAGLFFKDFQTIYVIKLRLSRFASATTWETPGCPHLHGNFGAGDVDSVRKFDRQQEQGWSDALLQESSWLE